MITLRQLEIFAAVNRHGSFRQCAEHMGVSQVSISEHIRSLEDRLGRKLFDRRPGGPAKLTEAGEVALVRTNAILADIGDFINLMSGGMQGGKRTISVAMDPFLMRNLHDLLQHFKATHADLEVKLDLQDHPIETLLARIADRQLDLAYFYTFDQTDAPGTTLLREEPLAIYVGMDHPLPSSRPITVAEFRQTPGIFLSKSNPLRGFIDRALAEIGADGGPIDLEIDDYGLLLHSVRRNHGFACMFLAAEQELRQSSGLRRIDLATALPPLQVRLATRRTSAQDGILQELKTLIGAAETASPVSAAGA